MSLQEVEELRKKFEVGMTLARKRLVERLKKENGELVISRNGKIVHVKAKDL
jgi:hypothetical protein